MIHWKSKATLSIIYSIETHLVCAQCDDQLSKAIIAKVIARHVNLDERFVGAECAKQRGDVMSQLPVGDGERGNGLHELLKMI